MASGSIAQTTKKLFNDNKNWIPFTWENMSFGGREFDKAIIKIPLKIDGINADFDLQFDLGATTTMLYGNSINYFFAKNAALAAQLDTVNKKYMIEGRMQGGFKSIKIKLGTQSFTLPNMAYFKGFGDTITDKDVKAKKPILLGTLGAPFFEGKTLIIDYPDQRILVLDSLDKITAAKFAMTNSRFDFNTLKIPFTIDGNNYWMMFDTGSSVFPIIAGEQYYNQFTGNSPVDSLDVPSWGKTLKAYGKQISKTVKIGNTTLSPNKIYMMTGHVWDDFYQRENIIGLTGNAYFLNSIIAIDFKHLKFGIYNDN